MSCTVPQLIRNTTTRLLTENHKTVSVINNHVYVGISPDSKIKTLEQAREFAKRLMNKVHKYFEAEKFGNILSFANDKPIPNTVGMYINIPQKLIDGYEKKYGKQGDIFNQGSSGEDNLSHYHNELGIALNKVSQIKNTIKNELPIEIANAVTVVQNVPSDILGRTDLFLSLKDILNDNGINDELLINWLGVNNNTLKVHPNSIKSEQQITNLIQGIYNKKRQVNNHPALQHNELAKESFEKWVKALERFPLPFQDLMLSHAIKQLNPERRNKYVLQLSDVALTNTYGQVQNQPHKLNQVGKIYDKEVLATVSDAVGHEPSASGKGYWIHIPRTENNSKRKQLENEIEYHQDILNSPDDKLIPNPAFYNAPEGVSDDNLAKDLKPFSKEKLQNLKNELKKLPVDNSAQYKVNVELLRKLSPSTWCTASSMAGHYVENYDNYLLVVDGVTVAGIEANPKDKFSKELDEANKQITVLENKIKEAQNPKYFYVGNLEKWKKNLKVLQEVVENLSKTQVKEVTSRGNNGIASIDHIDDIVAFFEKHNLDTNNDSLQRALEAKKKGKTDRDVIHENADGDWVDENEHDENWYIDEHNGEHEHDPPEYEEEYYQRRRDEKFGEAQTIHTVPEAITFINELDNGLYDAVQGLEPELLNNEQVASLIVEKDGHNISFINQELPFYKELAHKAVRQNNTVYHYISEEAKQEPRNIALYEAYIERVRNNANDALPFSKTNQNLIQGYYDANNDKVVLVASNIRVNGLTRAEIDNMVNNKLNEFISNGTIRKEC